MVFLWGFHMYWLEVQVKWEGGKVVLFGRGGDFHMYWLDVQVKWERKRWCYLGEQETFTCIG